MCKNNNVERKKKQRQIQEFLIRGVQTLVQKGLLNLLWQITSHRDDHVVLNL